MINTRIYDNEICLSGLSEKQKEKYINLRNEGYAVITAAFYATQE